MRPGGGVRVVDDTGGGGLAQAVGGGELAPTPIQGLGLGRGEEDIVEVLVGELEGGGIAAEARLPERVEIPLAQGAQVHEEDAGAEVVLGADVDAQRAEVPRLARAGGEGRQTAAVGGRAQGGLAAQGPELADVAEPKGVDVGVDGVGLVDKKILEGEAGVGHAAAAPLGKAVEAGKVKGVEADFDGAAGEAAGQGGEGAAVGLSSRPPSSTCSTSAASGEAWAQRLWSVTHSPQK